MTHTSAPTPSGGGMPQQPTAELQQQEQERQRERMPRVLRSYASAFERGHVSDSDAGLYVRRAADEIESLRAALLAARRENETAWLIEVPQSGGAMWWTGQEDLNGNLPDSSQLAWLRVFSSDASKAVRFRSEADAQAVLRLLPQSWKLWTYPAVVTDHRWCSGPDLAALAATPGDTATQEER